MTKTAAVPDLLKAFGLSRDTFNNWKRRGVLELESNDETSQGVTRHITERTAIRVGFMAILTSAGRPAYEAETVANAWAFQRSTSGLSEFIAFNPISEEYYALGEKGGDFKIAAVGDLIENNGIDEIADDAKDAENSPDFTASVFIVFNTKEVITRVNAVLI